MLLSSVSLLLCFVAGQAVNIIFINYWDGDTFQGNVTITAGKDLTSGWEMLLTFNHPLSQLILWDQDQVERRAGGREYVIKNRSQSHVTQNSVYTFQFQGKYGRRMPTSGTADWYGSSAVGGTTASTTAATTTTTTTAGTTTTTTTASPSGSYNYDQALEYSWLFYEAQRSGVLPADNRILWRGDSSVDDGSDVGLDLSGGWHDAGDHVKFGLPMSASTTMLLYGLIFFESGYQSANQYTEGLRQIRWPLDYFMKCHKQTDRFYAQVGNGDIDHAWWGRPEEMDEANLQRPSYVVGAGATAPGGADIMGETAAALAAGSILFKSSDLSYSQYLLSNATSLYQLGKSNTGVYNAAVPDGAKFYSSSAWQDEMAHAAAWLAKAHEGTNQQATYLTEAAFYLDDSSIWALDWSDKRGLVNLLMYHMTQENRYSTNIDDFLNEWLPGGSMQRTPLGLVFRLQWGSLRYSANAAFLAMLSAKEGIRSVDYFNFAKSQIDYMLGSTGRSYVVGFGVNPPKRPHHKAASCPYPAEDLVCDWEDYNADRDNPHVLYGALVGGPDDNDNYADDRTDYIKNEITCDYNAGFTGALAAMKYFAINPPA